MANVGSEKDKNYNGGFLIPSEKVRQDFIEWELNKDAVAAGIEKTGDNATTAGESKAEDYAATPIEEKESQLLEQKMLIIVVQLPKQKNRKIVLPLPKQKNRTIAIQLPGQKNQNCNSTAGTEKFDDCNSTVGTEKADDCISTGETEKADDCASTAETEKANDCASTAETEKTEDCASTAATEKANDCASTAGTEKADDCASTAGTEKADDCASTARIEKTRITKSEKYSYYNQNEEIEKVSNGINAEPEKASSYSPNVEGYDNQSVKYGMDNALIAMLFSEQLIEYVLEKLGHTWISTIGIRTLPCDGVPRRFTRVIGDVSIEIIHCNIYKISEQYQKQIVMNLSSVDSFRREVCITASKFFCKGYNPDNFLVFAASLAGYSAFHFAAGNTYAADVSAQILAYIINYYTYQCVFSTTYGWFDLHLSAHCLRRHIQEDTIEFVSPFDISPEE